MMFFRIAGFPQKFNKGGITLLYHIKEYFCFKSPRIKRRHKAFSDSFLGDLTIFMSSGKNRKESRARGHVSDLTPLNNTGGPGRFCVCEGSTCHLVRRPDTGVLARKGVHASHRDTEMALVSFLPNFVSVDIQLFPRIFKNFHHYYCLHFLVVYSTKEKVRKTIRIVKIKFKTGVCETFGSP